MTSTGVATAPSPFKKAGGFASSGLGSRRRIRFSSSGTPAPVNAEVKQTGIRCPSRSAFSKGSCSCSAEIALQQRRIHFDHLLDDVAVCLFHAQEISRGSFWSKKTVHHALAAFGR